MGFIVTAGAAGALAAAAFVGDACAAPSSAPAAPGATVTSNWSGYVANGSASSEAAPVSFTRVAATWVQPVAHCRGIDTATASSFWVGLGGNASSSSALEQAGTDSDCRVNGTATYFAWYELVPAGTVRLGLTIDPGDRISASVTVDGQRVVVSIDDLTRGRAILKKLTMASPDTSSAEWIAEAPSSGTSGPVTDEVALTDFGQVRFTGATATSGTHAGPISDHAWNHGAVELRSEAGSAFLLGGTQPNLVEAVPSGLSGGGRVFTVSWKAIAVRGNG